MFKSLVKIFIESRLNSINQEIEELSEIITQEEDIIKTKTTLAQSVFEFKPETTRRIRKLKTRVSLYLMLFGDIK